MADSDRTKRQRIPRHRKDRRIKETVNVSRDGRLQVLELRLTDEGRRQLDTHGVRFDQMDQMMLSEEE